MKLSQVFSFNALVALVYPIGFLIVPNTVIALHGLPEGAAQALMARYFAVALLGLGLIAWFVRDVAHPPLKDGITLSIFLSSLVGFVLSLQATLSGQMNAVGWLPTVVYLLLVLGFGYFRFFK
ncbi:MAG: hypothetical protein MUP44_01960 [Anaerolineales bacterium]|nr:hypothetical protein [Anaerolineales bacterium]